MTVGTVAYAAPEQLMGEEIDGRADQYALAASAYHLLTGSQLFPHSNPAVVISRLLNASPPAVSQLRPAPAGLDAILAKTLSKKPGDRYARCTDFARALASQADASPQSLPSAPTAEAKAPQRNTAVKAPPPLPTSAPAVHGFGSRRRWLPRQPSAPSSWLWLRPRRGRSCTANKDRRPDRCCPALNVQTMASSSVPMIGAWERPRSAL